MHTNRLAQEKSPYLLQHAHNPVDWYPWGPEAFEKARSENKPIFLSIGYSTCHWCHVMERESFEDEQIAGQLNRDFVPIKVDREERPDVDRIYMTFVQATTGGGGWPMSVWLTPELKPFYGGTYFPPEHRWNQPGFGSVLAEIANAWRMDRARVEDSARDVVEQLRKSVGLPPARPGAPVIDSAILDSGFYAFRRSFDTRLGGFGSAPKFPRPSVNNFLLRYYARTRNREALDMVLVTLREMARGGMNDQLGGGFHRYSVDERWFVPHFEKMLYDEGQLAISYLEAFQITGEAVYAETARRIFDYVLRDMTDAGGAFYSAEDADSVIDPAEPSKKGEGAFYIWDWAEIREVAGYPAADWFGYRYGVEERGNVAHDPHDEFHGKNILYQAHTVEETAAHFEREIDEVRTALLQAERELFAARSKRVRPHLDDKILTAWNGLMISALALGGAVLREPVYADAARNAAQFLIQQMYDPQTGVLLRRYREGTGGIPGFLDDYALLTQSLLDLYETQFDGKHLEMAIRLAEKQRELFEDPQGGFFSSADGDASLVLRVKEDYDGAEPSGNSVTALNLLRLAQMTGRADFRESAERLISAFGSRLSTVPMAIPQMLVAYEFLMSEPRQIVIVGDRGAPDTLSLAQTVHSIFVPNRVVLMLDSEEARERLSVGVPALRSMEKLGERAAAYVCQNYTCQLPVTAAKQLAGMLQVGQA
jgi:uncharacterized protein YyaL (SSP411 family)